MYRFRYKVNTLAASRDSRWLHSHQSAIRAIENASTTGSGKVVVPEYGAYSSLRAGDLLELNVSISGMFISSTIIMDREVCAALRFQRLVGKSIGLQGG
jgi:hypothetical protein